jgi:hypothetical protein
VWLVAQEPDGIQLGLGGEQGCQLPGVARCVAGQAREEGFQLGRAELEGLIQQAAQSGEERRAGPMP